MTIALFATIAGADDYVAMVAWARRHQPWLARFLDLSRGIPSHDCLNRLFRRLRTDEFERWLPSWPAALHDASGGTLVAIDGKRLRRSLDTAAARSALHLVSAWAISQRLSLGSVAVEEKSSELTAIPELLKLSGAVVTIDAMGCQAEIARAIVDGGGDYILAVKENQPPCARGSSSTSWISLVDDFARAVVSRHETKEKGHGREEHRTYCVLDARGAWSMRGVGRAWRRSAWPSEGRRGAERPATTCGISFSSAICRPAGPGRCCGAAAGSRIR